MLVVDLTGGEYIYRVKYHRAIAFSLLKYL